MMEKVAVPKYVAEFIEVKKEINSLEGIVKDYDFFSKTLGNLTSEHLSAIEWYVENPYEFIRAFVEGYEVEEEKYYWRKKREYIVSFEKDIYLHITGDLPRMARFTNNSYKYSESEVRERLSVTDFELFEKVEEGE